MQRKTSITLIIILSVLALLCTASLILGIVYFNGNHFINITSPFVFTEKDIKKSEEFDIVGIEKLTLSLKSSDVTVIPTVEDKIRIEQYAKSKKETSELFTSRKIGNEIEVLENQSSSTFCIFCFGNYSVQYKVYIPEKYTKDLSITLSSGELYIKNSMVLQNVTLETKSGDINVTNMTASLLDIEAGSGEIKGKNIYTKTLNIMSHSGDVYVHSLTGTFDVETSSGEVYLKKVDGMGSIKVGSGDITVRDFKIEGKTTIDTHSGEVSIGLKDDSNCSIIANTKSGETSFPNDSHTIGSEPYHTLSIKTGSGDIRTYKR